jgi:hypothetical protein
MVANFSTIVFSPVASTLTFLAICYRLPKRTLRNILIRLKGRDPGTSLWLAFSTSFFSASLDYNWPLVLVRPRWIGRYGGVPYPPKNVKPNDAGFEGFLYINDKLKDQATQSTIHGADAVWIHAHGGGFKMGEARQYHTTYRRWIRKALKDYGLDLRILAVEYRKYSVPYGVTSLLRHA